MIDIHSHILPKIDDGSKSIEETFEMLNIAINKETTDIVATPHYCIGYGEEKFNNVRSMARELQKLVKEKDLDINIHYGQEVYYSTRLLEDLEEENIGTINDGRYMLIELNMKELTDEEEIYETIYELKIKGIIPVIAHPERYKYLQESKRKINRFIEEGCLFQLNAGSIEGRHGTEAKKCAEVLLKNKVYSFIGSDTHDVKNRKPGIKKAIDIAKEIDEEIEDVFEENGTKLLENKKVEFHGSLIEHKRRKKKKGIFSFFKR
ncbi:MAG: tyrosine-protein phosphatase [Clostridium sp.]|uniref:tyrosine-protein phosphatase n=1 Tax=Clostridium sp. TaxID=1506 RepID=UPI003F306332